MFIYNQKREGEINRKQIDNQIDRLAYMDILCIYYFHYCLAIQLELSRDYLQGLKRHDLRGSLAWKENLGVCNEQAVPF